MKQIGEETGLMFFLRDAENILSAECILPIGTKDQAQGLNCGHCGVTTCWSRSKGVPCEIHSVDIGIAIGSACVTAPDHRVETRDMFSAVMAAQ